MNWPADAEVGVVAIAISCSIRLKMGSLLISAVLCIQVPVLISSSCFLRHRMHTHIICNVIIIICQGYQYIIFKINQCCTLKIFSFCFLLFFQKYYFSLFVNKETSLIEIYLCPLATVLFWRLRPVSKLCCGLLVSSFSLNCSRFISFKLLLFLHYSIPHNTISFPRTIFLKKKDTRQKSILVFPIVVFFS